MPQIRNYGNPISAGSVGPRQSPSAPTSSVAIAPIQVRHFVRNGMSPHASLANRVREAANYAALYRSKEVFCALGFEGYNCPGGSGVVHRFAFHTGPYTHALRVVAVLYPPIVKPPLPAATQATTTINVYSDAAMTTLVGSLPLYYGPKPQGASFGWRMARPIDGWLDGVAPDTDYYGSISVSDSGKCGGLCICDMQSLTENYSGYLSVNLTTHSPVLSNDRSDVSTMLTALWKKGGAQVFNWSGVGQTPVNYVNFDVNGGAEGYITTTSTTLTNLIDGTSTSNTGSSAGYTLEMSFKDRVSQTSGVPCKIAVWGYSAGSPGDGTVVLVNSSGTTIATVTGFTTTPGWVTATCSLPALQDKYDLQFKSNAAGVRFFVGAVSVWEQE